MLKNLGSQKLIILSVIIFFILSSIWLFFISAKYMNPDYNSDWWALHFADPKDQSLNFTIENHSLKNNFHWEITDGTKNIEIGDVEIFKSQKKNIPIDIQNVSDKKIIIRVSTDNNEVKEIYKNL
jgi:hypothetical protein